MTTWIRILDNVRVRMLAQTINCRGFRVGLDLPRRRLSHRVVRSKPVFDRPRNPVSTSFISQNGLHTWVSCLHLRVEFCSRLRCWPIRYHHRVILLAHLVHWSSWMLPLLFNPFWLIETKQTYPVLTEDSFDHNTGALRGKREAPLATLRPPLAPSIRQRSVCNKPFWTVSELCLVCCLHCICFSQASSSESEIFN